MLSVDYVEAQGSLIYHKHRIPSNVLAVILQSGGVLLVAPEHRLSLHLKYHELRLQFNKQQRQDTEDEKEEKVEGSTKLARAREAALAVCSALEGVAALPYLDILDESDELLHHR